MTKEKRIQQFLKLQDSISTINLDYSVPEVIKPNEIKNIKKNLFVKNISFFHGNVLEIMQSCPEAVILVFCSSKNPGGGVLRGSKAQEEDISLHSTWYFQVKELTDFYLEKHSSAINTDNLIYIEKSYLLKDLYHNDIKPVCISFIGSTAVNLNGLQQQRISTFNYEQIMSQRIEKILQLAETKNKKHLILGAFGCGVFGGNPTTVAKLFNEKIKAGFFTGLITFAIMDEKIIDIFKKEINH